MKYRIVVDPDLCIGAASCVTVAPDAFTLNAENKAEVLDHGQAFDTPQYERTVELTCEELENVLTGAQSCPTLAIEVFEENGKKLYP